MALPEFRPAVVLLPDAAPFRALVAQAIQRAEAELLPAHKAVEAEIAVVDMRVPGGPDAVKELLAASDHNEIAVLAVVDWADPRGVDEARELGALDLLGAEHLEEELPIRLRMAHQRRRKRIELLQSKKHLSLVLKLTADYAESHDVVELLHDVTRRLAEEMDILRASLVVLDEEQAAGFVIAASDDAALKSLKIELARYPEIREVVRTGKPVLIEDVPTHPLLEGVKSHVTSRGIRAIAALPLAVHGKVLGVLLLRAAGRRRGFTQHEMDLLATVAHATAVALRNVRLIESERGHLAREKSARIAAEERAAQLQRYEAFFANISEGIAILDDQARLISINPAGTRMLDLDAQDARGQHITALTNSTDEAVLMDTLWAITRGEPRRELDLAVRTGAGHRRTLAACAAPMRDGDAAAILSFRDVTVQRQLADELRQTKDFLERLIDSSVDGIIAADMKGRVILYNKGAEALCGYTPEEALAGLNVSNIYPPKVAREVMGRLRGLESGGKGRLSATRLELLSKRGERVPVNMTASIIFEEDREVATVGIFTDLRDRVQLERKLSDAETRLEESERNAVIVALAGTAAHELNQPLTSVMGYAELLKRKLKESDFAYRPVDIIYREAERMAEIVRKIGKITRYETKSYVGSAKILDLDKASSHEE